MNEYPTQKESQTVKISANLKLKSEILNRSDIDSLQNHKIKSGLHVKFD